MGIKESNLYVSKNTGFIFHGDDIAPSDEVVKTWSEESLFDTVFPLSLISISEQPTTIQYIMICKNLKELALVAKKYKLIVLSDEIYTDLTFCNKYESISKFYPERTFISGGLSKWCGAGGWRVGFFAVPKKLSNFLETIVTLASESYSTVNTPAQYAAVQAYQGDFTEYKNKTLNILRSVGNYVYNNLKSNKVLVNQPQGAFYLMPEFLNKKFKNSTHLCEIILEETGVAMLPASDFGFNPKRLLTRLCYIDFDGNEFLKADISEKVISDKIIEKYAPNVVEGVQKLSNWAKNL